CTYALLVVSLVAFSRARGQKGISSFKVGEKGLASVSAVAISPDGKQAAALVRGDPNDDDHHDHIRLWDVRGKKEVARIYPEQEAIRGRLFAYTTDGKSIVCSSAKAVYFYDLKTRKLARSFKTKVSPQLAVLSGDGKTVVCADVDVASYD